MRCASWMLSGLLSTAVFVQLLSVALTIDSQRAYVVENDSFGEGIHQVRLKVLRNRVTNERAEVAWNAGGRTEALLLRGPSGRLREVLLHSRRNASDVFNNIGWKGDMLIPYANRIKNGTYTLSGRTYYMERNEDRSPWGRQGLHGYLYRKQMHVAAALADNNSAKLVLTYDFDGTDPGYPFKLSVALTYILDHRGLTITTHAENRAKGGLPLPFYNSWHSYFVVSDVSQATVTLDRCSHWNHIDVSNNSNKNGDLIPTGLTTPFDGFNGKERIGGTYAEPTYWDDEFKAVGSARDCPNLTVRIDDASSAETSVLWMDSEFRWVQVFTGAPQAFGEQAVAVEAMSSECDAWNNMQGIRLLQAGEQWQGSFGVYLESSIAQSSDLFI